MTQKNHISTFETFNSAPVTLPLSQWIRATANPKCEHAERVKAYRKTGDDSIKKNLPLATVGAVCEGGRKMENVSNRTGFISLDIDAKDNEMLGDAETIRDAIAKNKYIAFAGLSVSGKGVWALVKVANPEKQAEYFKQLKTDFYEKMGIWLDPSKGKNPNDARFYSFDPNAYIAKSFNVYDRLPSKPKRKPQPRPRRTKYHSNGKDTRSKVETLTGQINTDITAGYDNWLKLGFALESEFGESGRDYFHAISQYHPDYNRRETDRQYNRCLKHKGQGVSIGTFFHVCREHGFMLRPENSHTNTLKEKDNGSTGKYERGYPPAWDDIQLEPDTEQYRRATMIAMQDGTPNERDYLINNN